MEELKKQLQDSRSIFEAIASDVRLAILYQLMECAPKGKRICEIKLKKCITRPTLSHHFKLLVKAKLISFYREGTKNYYYLDVDAQAIDSCIGVLQKLKEIQENPHASN